VSKEIAPAALANVLQHPTQKMTAGGMPPVKLSALELTALVAYVESLGSSIVASADSTTATKPEASAPSPAQSPSSPKQAASRTALVAMNELQTKGKQIFKAHRCADCHGADGLKGTAAAPGLVGKSFPPEVLTNMLRHPTTVMKKGGMPPVSLSDDELKALVAYVSYISASKSSPDKSDRN
jgi:mono/diheme cytochrome c family protein